MRSSRTADLRNRLGDAGDQSAGILSTRVSGKSGEAVEPVHRAVGEERGELPQGCAAVDAGLSTETAEPLDDLSVCLRRPESCIGRSNEGDGCRPAEGGHRYASTNSAGTVLPAFTA